MASATNTTLGEIILGGDLAGGTDGNYPELRASGVTPGVYTPAMRLSIDSRGRVTSAGKLDAAEITTAIGVATTSTLGVIKVGAGLANSSDFLISDPIAATMTSPGTVIISTDVPTGQRLSVADGVLSITHTSSNVMAGLVRPGTNLKISDAVSAKFAVAQGVALLNGPPGLNSMSNGSSVIDTFSTFNGAVVASQRDMAVSSTNMVEDTFVLNVTATNDNVQATGNDFLATPPAGSNTAGNIPSRLAYGNGYYAFLISSTLTGTVPKTKTASPVSFPVSMSNITTGHYALMSAYGAGKYVSFGYKSSGGAIAYSSDGVTWTNTTVLNLSANGWLSWSGSYFLGVNKPSAAAGSNTFIKSVDGITWTTGTLSGTVDKSVGWPIASSGSLDVVMGIGGNSSMTSTDGSAWTTMGDGGAGSGASYGRSNPLDCAFGAGLFVFVGEQASCYTSPTGATWTARTLTGVNTTTHSARWIQWTGSKFVVISEDSTFRQPVISTSTNGTTWNAAINPGLDSNIQWTGFGYTGSTFTLLGRDALGNLQSAFSLDGEIWYGGATYPARVDLTLPVPTNQILNFNFITPRAMTINPLGAVKKSAGSNLTKTAAQFITLTAIANNGQWLITSE